MPTYELPDLEENLDEACDSPQERRHSVDTPMSNNPGRTVKFPELPRGTYSASGIDLLVLNASSPSVEFPNIEPNPDLHQWWTDLFEL
ncbi:hypothetical protein Y032_0008g206 [Ancylostoma ceylanicum]|nr:hypothetical protein Y032_0008g206 [Ancylostoma ceylanicum]